jgi:hypothetical protein
VGIETGVLEHQGHFKAMGNGNNLRAKLVFCDSPEVVLIVRSHGISEWTQNLKSS